MVVASSREQRWSEGKSSWALLMAELHNAARICDTFGQMSLHADDSSRALEAPSEEVHRPECSRETRLDYWTFFAAAMLTILSLLCLYLGSGHVCLRAIVLCGLCDWGVGLAWVCSMCDRCGCDVDGRESGAGCLRAASGPVGVSCKWTFREIWKSRLEQAKPFLCARKVDRATHRECCAYCD